MTLTPQQRIEAYEWVIAQLNTHKSQCHGVCVYLEKWLEGSDFKDDSMEFNFKYTLNLFHEFRNKMPENKDCNIAWFPMGQYKIRIQKLTECIAEAKLKIVNNGK
jgi:hypothetical protein